MKLRILEAYKEDSERGIIRIDPSIQTKLDLNNGEAIEIYLPKTMKKTVALLYPGKIEDKGTKTIRMNSLLRRNIDARVDDLVSIRKIEAPIAERIIFAPYYPLIFSKTKIEENPSALESYLRGPSKVFRSLENRVVSRGYIFRLSKKPIDIREFELKVMSFLKEERNSILGLIKIINKSHLSKEQICNTLKERENMRKIRRSNRFLLTSIRKSKAQIYYDLVVYMTVPGGTAVRIGINTKFDYRNLKQGYIGLFPTKDIKLENVVRKLKEVSLNNTKIELGEFQRILSISNNLFNRSLYKWALEFNFKVENNKDLIYNKEDMMDFISMFQREFSNINFANKALPEKSEYLNLNVTNIENKDENFKILINRLKEIAEVTTHIQINELKSILGVRLMSNALFDPKLYEWAKEFNFKFEKDSIIFEKNDILNFINMLENKYKDWENWLKKK